MRKTCWPGYEKSGRAKGDVNRSLDATFFSGTRIRGVRRKRSGGGEENGLSEGGKEGKFFAEVGREREQRKREGWRMGSEQRGGGEEEEMGTPWGPHSVSRLQNLDTLISLYVHVMIQLFKHDIVRYSLERRGVQVYK